MMTCLQNGLIYPFVAVRFLGVRTESIRSISHANECDPTVDSNPLVPPWPFWAVAERLVQLSKMLAKGSGCVDQYGFL